MDAPNIIPNAMAGLAVICAIPAVIFALWCEYYGQSIENKNQIAKPDKEKIALQLSNIKLAGMIAVIVQLLAFISAQPLRAQHPIAGTAFFILGILVQGVLQAKLEFKLRPYMDIKPETAAKSELKLLWRSLFGFLLGGFTYAICLVGSMQAFYWLGKLTHANRPLMTLALLLGVGIGIAGGMILNYALGAFHLRMALPVRRMERNSTEDSKFYALFEDCFRRARLNPPEFWVLNNTGPSSNNALVAGFMSGRGIFKPGFFISKNILEKFSEGELKAIALHEAAHLTLHHLRNRFLYSVYLLFGLTLMATLFLVTSQLFAPGSALIMAPLVAISTFFLAYGMMSRQSISHELEADVYSIDFLGGNLEDLTRALRKIDLMNGRGPLSITDGSHPMTEQRIQALEMYFDNKRARVIALDRARKMAENSKPDNKSDNNDQNKAA